MTTEDRTIQRDRMRFIKNSFSANLAYLGILLDVFYFVSIYKSDVGTYYYNYIIGISIVYNLIFMLAVFLSSEGVKNYKKGYSYLLAAIGIIQVVRIFIIPMQAHVTETICSPANQRAYARPVNAVLSFRSGRAMLAPTRMLQYVGCRKT